MNKLLKFLGIECWHKWKEVEGTDWLITSMCEKCGKTKLEEAPW